MYVTDPPAKFSAVAICNPETCSLARLGSPAEVFAGFPARVSITTPMISTSTKTPPMAIGIQLRFSLCSAEGENTGSFSESPMAEILNFMSLRSKQSTVISGFSIDTRGGAGIHACGRRTIEEPALAAEVTSLLAGDGHPVNPQRRASRRPAKLQVIANLSDVVQHVLEITGNSHFFHGISKLAVFNPQAAHAAGKIAGNSVHAKTEKLKHVKSLFDVSDNLLRRAITFLQIKISTADSRRSGQSAGRVAGSLHP